MIAMSITHCPCCEGDLSTIGTWGATASLACLLGRYDQTTAKDYAEDYAALEFTRLLDEGKRERLLARRLIRAAGRRDSRIGWRRFQVPHRNAVEARTPEHPYRLRLMECNRWD